MRGTTADSAASAEIHALAFTEAGRALANQQRSLESLRQRTSTVVAAGGVIFGFYGVQAATSSFVVNDWLRAAIAAFLLAAVAALLVLWPWRFTFRNSIQDLLMEISASGEQVAAGQLRGLHYDWAYWMNKNYDTNARTIRRMVFGYEVALVAITLEVGSLGGSMVFR